MDQRLKLQARLESIPGVVMAAFQPPSNLVMRYPAIVYALDDIDTVFASNKPYRQSKRYQVTVIDRNPDSPIVDLIAAMPKCSFSRRFSADNLTHTVFTLYF